jgi:gliding motility-associated-like protein
MKKVILLMFAGLFMHKSYSQAYDNCDQAFNIANPANYCSGATEFTLANTTTSGFMAANCWDQQSRDIWFKFTATALSADIIVNGGTLQRPQVAVYSGTCTTVINTLNCTSATSNSSAQVNVTNLKIGQVYLIRVAGRANSIGTFQLCVSNYNAPVLPGQDCNTGAVLCDKESFVVQSVTGSGLVKNEGDGTCLQPTLLATSEDQSTWFKWTAADNGTLNFDIVPLKDNDDIDFALYELSNISTCAGKQVLRCVATACEGPTGIRIGEPGTSENAGCEPGENGYVNGITQSAGKHYALLINNFTQSKIGFKLNFGGTATFGGPQPNFTAVQDPICGTKFKVSLAGAAVPGYKYNWIFGDDADVKTAVTAGPHDINYVNGTGERFITLTIETSQGCKVTKTVKVNLTQCCNLVVNAENDKTVTDGATTSLNATYTPVRPGDTFLWSPPRGIINTQIQNTTVVVDTPLTYYITVKDAQGCTARDSVVIKLSCDPQKLPKITATVRPPLCKGTPTAKINFTGTGGTGSLTYSLNNNPYVNTNIFDNLLPGTYKLKAKDAKGCIDSIPVIIPDVPGITANAGPDRSVDFLDTFFLSGTYTPKNPGDEIRWIPGSAVFDSTNLNTRSIALEDRDYILNIKNSDGCIFNDTFKLKILVNCAKLPPLGLKTTTNGLTCPNKKDGTISAIGTGLYPPFTYSISNGPYAASNTFNNLGASRFVIAVRDRLGCVQRDSVTITEAPSYQVNAGPDQSVDLGETVTLTGSYTPKNSNDSIVWSPINRVDSPNDLTTIATPAGSTTFILGVKSSEGCLFQDSVRITTSSTYKLITANTFKPGSTNNGIFNLVGSKTATQIDELNIYDRWGNKVYQGRALDPKNPADGWNGNFNGEPLPEGVYLWNAVVRFLDDNTQVFKGDITLLR